MTLSTPTQALWKNAPRPPRRLSVVCDLRGDIKTCSNESFPSKQRSVRSSWPPRTSAPSPSAFASTPPARRGSKTQAILTNFQARRHLRGECLAHPWGCDCEKVQRPTFGHAEAWQLMALRFKAAHNLDVGEVHRPALLVPSTSGAKAPLERQRSETLPHHANALYVEVWEKGGKSVEKVLSRHPARSSTSAVLAVPTRVAQRLKPVGHDSRPSTASRYGGAKDALRTSRARPSTTPSGMRNKVATRI